MYLKIIFFELINIFVYISDRALEPSIGWIPTPISALNYLNLFLLTHVDPHESNIFIHFIYCIWKWDNFTKTGKVISIVDELKGTKFMVISY